MSLSQALKLGKVELSGINGTQPKLRRLGQIVRLFASEVAGTLQLAPFGLKASTLYSKLQPPPDSAISSSSDDDVYLVKSIYYGTRPRNTVDLYLPKKAQRQQQQHQGLPVVLFVHGGEPNGRHAGWI
jgi:acetyl esterase/lipase